MGQNTKQLQKASSQILRRHGASIRGLSYIIVNNGPTEILIGNYYPAKYILNSAVYVGTLNVNKDGSYYLSTSYKDFSVCGAQDFINFHYNTLVDSENATKPCLYPSLKSPRVLPHKVEFPITICFADEELPQPVNIKIYPGFSDQGGYGETNAIGINSEFQNCQIRYLPRWCDQNSDQDDFQVQGL